MRAWPRHPVVHEVFTWVWLGEVSARAGRPVTLADVPAPEWDAVARPGVDVVWLMGVWERSPMGAAIARSTPSMRSAAEAALPGVDGSALDEAIVGSAYCVRSWTVDPHLGGDAGLAVARAALAERGVRLVLDLVPNHVAPDHPWVTEHPEWFVRGTRDDLARDPASFIELGGHVFALGRDPYFPAWPEVVQLDASSAALRAAMVDEVGSIAGRCDGVRCDMAMLLLDDVFHRTWGDRAAGGPSPDGGRGYWPTVIEGVKAEFPEFVFWAEAYWDLEPALLAQGFDACYDKRLYDRLVHGEPADSLRAHLAAPVDWQAHTVRFAENHDEPRAASILSPAAHRAVLTTVMTVPGVALLHEGEADGRSVRTPVILGRRCDEPADRDLREWVDRLLGVLADGMRDGDWQMVHIDGWPDNRSAERLVAWTWTGGDRACRFLVVVNRDGSGQGRADGMVRLPWRDLSGPLTLVDRLSGAAFERDGDDLVANGLYVALDGDCVHLLELR